MVARRVIDDHLELANSGALTHGQLDDYLKNTPWIVISGSISEPPERSRLLKNGKGITITDDGPGSDIVINTTLDPDRIALLSGSIFDGPTVFSGSTYGSITRLADKETPYIVGGNSIQVVTSSIGQITINYDPNPAGSFAFLPAKWNEKPIGVIDGNNVLFSLQYAPSPSDGLMLFLNGVLLEKDDDYMLSGNQVMMLYPPTTRSKLKASYPVYDALDISWNEVPVGEIDGYNNVFSLKNTPIDPLNLMLFLNGVLQDQGADEDYVLNGNVITFVGRVPITGSKLKAVYQAQGGVKPAIIDALASISAGNTYRKGSFLGNQVSGRVLNFSTLGSLKSGYDHHRDIDVYINGMLLRGASSGGDYQLLDKNMLYLEGGIKSDDIITIIIRNAEVQ